MGNMFTDISSLLVGGVGGAITAGGVSSAKKDEKIRLQALNLRMKQIQDAATQNSIENEQKLSRNLATQTAYNAAQGGGTAGPVSSNMIKFSDINAFAEDENAEKLSTVFQEEGVQSQIIQSYKDEQTQEENSMIQGISTSASLASNLYSGMPTGSIGTNSKYATKGSDTGNVSQIVPNIKNNREDSYYATETLDI